MQNPHGERIPAGPDRWSRRRYGLTLQLARFPFCDGCHSSTSMTVTTPYRTSGLRDNIPTFILIVVSLQRRLENPGRAISA
jgi:hypothetical protein